ncbi:MAG TPA: hypothetical protein VFI82_00650 [Terriglobales bacterium]|nr:hypothetical protein [Terriglobales bacterium]
MVLLGTMVFLGQLPLISPALSARTSVAACHHHANPPEIPSGPASHDCCAVGHNAAIVLQHDLSSATDAVTMPLAAQPSTTPASGQRLAAMVLRADSPPGPTFLRI